MTSSNDFLREFARHRGSNRNPYFRMIIPFDFYDGLETGVALISSGGAVRIWSLGDSRSRLFRALGLVPIGGNWLETEWISKQSDTEHGSFLEPDNSEALLKLEADVMAAQATGYFVGLGSPYLNCIEIVEVDEDEVNILQQDGPCVENFRRIHNLLKQPR